MNFSKKKDVKIIYDDLNIFQPVESILRSRKRDEFLIKYSQYCNKYYCTLTILHHSSSYREGMLIFFLEVGSISTRSRRIKNESGQTGKINFVRTRVFSRFCWKHFHEARGCQGINASLRRGDCSVSSRYTLE